MTTEEFRKNPELVAELRGMLEKPAMKLWLEAMYNASPVHSAVPIDVTPTVANIVLGAHQGYHRYHNLFKTGGTHPTVQTPMEEAAMRLEEEE